MVSLVSSGEVTLLLENEVRAAHPTPSRCDLEDTQGRWRVPIEMNDKHASDSDRAVYRCNDPAQDEMCGLSGLPPRPRTMLER